MPHLALRSAIPFTVAAVFGTTLLVAACGDDTSASSPSSANSSSSAGIGGSGGTVTSSVGGDGGTGAESGPGGSGSASGGAGGSTGGASGGATLVHAASFGGAAKQSARALAVDEDGNAILGGGFSSSLDFGCSPALNGVTDDIFIASIKSDQAGCNWAQKFGGNVTHSAARALAVDSDDVWMAGEFAEELIIGSDTLNCNNTENCGVLARFDRATGNAELALRLSSNFLEQLLTAVAVDSGGNALIGGTFQSSITLGSGCNLTATGSTGDIDAFIAKFSTAGTCIWSTRLGSAEAEQVMSIAVDSNNNVIAAGEHRGGLSLGGACGTDAGNGATDAWVAKFDSNGDCLWTENLGGEGFDDAAWLTVDSSDRVIVGSYRDTPAVGQDIEVRLDVFEPDGTSVWSSELTHDEGQFVLGVATDSNDNILVTGRFDGSLDFGCGPLLSKGNGDVFLAKLYPSGECIWSDAWGSDSLDQAVAVAALPDDRIAITGYHNGDIDFGGGVLANQGSDDVFLAVFEP